VDRPTEAVTGLELANLPAKPAGEQPKQHNSHQEKEPWISASHALFDCSVSMNLARGVGEADPSCVESVLLLLLLLLDVRIVGGGTGTCIGAGAWTACSLCGRADTATPTCDSCICEEGGSDTVDDASVGCLLGKLGSPELGSCEFSVQWFMEKEGAGRSRVVRGERAYAGVHEEAGCERAVIAGTGPENGDRATVGVLGEEGSAEVVGWPWMTKVGKRRNMRGRDLMSRTTIWIGAGMAGNRDVSATAKQPKSCWIARCAAPDKIIWLWIV